MIKLWFRFCRWVKSIFTKDEKDKNVETVVENSPPLGAAFNEWRKNNASH